MKAGVSTAREGAVLTAAAGSYVAELISTSGTKSVKVLFVP